MLKKITLAVLSMATSSFALAGAMGPVCTPGHVTVPCVNQAWDLGVQALYLKPIYGATKGYQFTAVNSPIAQYDQVPRDWDWGYRLEGSYHFNTGNDATLVWTHFKDTANGFGYGTYFIPVSPFFIPRETSIQYTNQFDQVNLVMGQHVDMSMNDKLRFYGGLQYAHLLTNVTTTFFNSPIGSTFTSVNGLLATDYKGIGPVVGIDYSYYLSQAFSLTANGAGSILYGKSRINRGFVGLPSNVVYNSMYGDKWSMVPSIEAKLGLNYEYAMANGVLNLQGGYQVLDYINSMQTFGLVSLTTLNGTIDETSYGLYGPYFGVKYVGNV
ncbi:MAG: hypothetical protein EPN84_02615 [Legionella sp.]|nr:MAG: hypothetical protein EPN84_02615 [Legionella sp.]